MNVVSMVTQYATLHNYWSCYDDLSSRLSCGCSRQLDSAQHFRVCIDSIISSYVGPFFSTLCNGLYLCFTWEWISHFIAGQIGCGNAITGCQFVYAKVVPQ